MTYCKGSWRRWLARVVMLALVIGAVPASVLAGETPPPAQAAPTLTASIQKAVAMEVGKVEKGAPGRLAKQDTGATTTDLTSKSFFKSTAGILTLVLVGVGAGYALYSTSNDRVKSPAK